MNILPHKLAVTSDQLTSRAGLYEFKHLYHLRWGIEEHYKRLKQWVEIENFSGKLALSVQQGFHAKILTTNLTVMLANTAQKQVDNTCNKRILKYKINFA